MKLAVPLILLAIVAYLPATRGDFIWDDDLYVSENPTLRLPNALHEIWYQPKSSPQYYPFVFTTFWLEYQLWGLNPAGYHWTNILLHGVNAILVWLVLRKLEVPGSWFIAALFALHPVHAESVAWITERKNVLSAFFYGLAMLSFLRFFRAESSRPWDWYVVGLILFSCALLSKTVTCSLPAVLVLILWWKSGRVALREAAALLPLFAIGAGFAYLTVTLEKSHVGAQGEDWNFTFVERFLIAGRAVWFYVYKLIVPLNLSFIYPRWTIDASDWTQWLYPISALAVVGMLWALRNRIGRGPLVAVLYFGGTLVPALGFFNVYPMLFSFVADHFQYLASIGILALVTEAVLRAVNHQRSTALNVAAAAVLLTLGFLTWRQAGVYRDLETLWKDTIDKNPDAWMAHYNLGQFLVGRAHTDKAMPEDIPSAMASYSKVIELRPKYWQAYNSLGSILAEGGKVDEAIGLFRKAIALKPPHVLPQPFLYRNLAGALALKGAFQESLEAANKVLLINNKDSEAHFLRGRALVQLKQPGAEKAFEATLQINPKQDAAAFALAQLLLERGEIRRAIRYLQQAVDAKPTLVPYRIALGNALLKDGRADEANVHFRRALELDPNSPL